MTTRTPITTKPPPAPIDDLAGALARRLRLGRATSTDELTDRTQHVEAIARELERLERVPRGA